MNRLDLSDLHERADRLRGPIISTRNLRHNGSFIGGSNKMHDVCGLEKGPIIADMSTADQNSAHECTSLA